VLIAWCLKSARIRWPVHFEHFLGQGLLTLGSTQVGWRCRAKLAVRGTSEDPQIGLFEEGTHSIVDIPLCRSTFHFSAILEILFAYYRVRAFLTSEVGYYFIEPFMYINLKFAVFDVVIVTCL
jgi:hypothetical protein